MYWASSSTGTTRTKASVPPSLYALVVTLMENGLVDLPQVLAHLTPSLQELHEQYKTYTSRVKSTASKSIRVSLLLPSPLKPR